ncbi:MAG: hypothetical protein ACE5ES_02065 [Candidatus Nanoarchaeia archaeon]
MLLVTEIPIEKPNLLLLEQSTFHIPNKETLAELTETGYYWLDEIFRRIDRDGYKVIKYEWRINRNSEVRFYHNGEGSTHRSKGLGISIPHNQMETDLYILNKYEMPPFTIDLYFHLQGYRNSRIITTRLENPFLRQLLEVNSN